MTSNPVPKRRKRNSPKNEREMDQAFVDFNQIIIDYDKLDAKTDKDKLL